MGKDLQRMTQRYDEMEKMCLGYVKRVHDVEAINADLLEVCELLYRLNAEGVFTLPDQHYRAITMAAAAIAKAHGESTAATERS